ncbi:MAG: hypothetical protein KDD60_01120, partial [Bdellovibrionales bacterium]|nr:hypothetical protein [Bdellovibrionales bacterium]
MSEWPMEWEGKSCVVCVHDKDSLTDIQHSLKMLKLSVRGATDLVHARAELISGEEPALILVEGDAEDRDGVIRDFVRSVKSHPSLYRAPVCLMVQVEEGEKESAPSLAQVSAPVDGVLHLPVEFPNFSREVRRMLEQYVPPVGAVANGDGSEKVVPAPLQEVAPKVGAGVKVEAPLGGQSVKTNGVSNVTSQVARLLDRRLVVAYGLQLAILEQLERDERFLRAEADEIPS